MKVTIWNAEVVGTEPEARPGERVLVHAPLLMGLLEVTNGACARVPDVANNQKSLPTVSAVIGGRDAVAAPFAAEPPYISTTGALWETQVEPV